MAKWIKLEKKSTNEQGNDICTINYNYFKERYACEIRNSFLKAFKAFYCDNEMNIPFLNDKSTGCKHHKMKLNYTHFEMSTYLKNILTETDFKFKYVKNDINLRNLNQTFAKKSYINSNDYFLYYNPKDADSDSQLQRLNNDNEISNLSKKANNENNTATTIRPQNKSSPKCGFTETLTDDSATDKENNENNTATTIRPRNISSSKRGFTETLTDDSEVLSLTDKANNENNTTTTIRSRNKSSYKRRFTETLTDDPKDISLTDKANNENNTTTTIRSRNKSSYKRRFTETLTDDPKDISLTDKANNEKNTATTKRPQIKSSSKHGFTETLTDNSEDLSLTDKIISNESTMSDVEVQAIFNLNDKNTSSALTTSSSKKRKYEKKVPKSIYTRNFKGETKLHEACSKGNLKLVRALLADGFNPNIKDNAGWTPLHEAVKSGNLNILKELINYGAYLNVPGNEYKSPLYIAIEYDQYDVAVLLVDNGIDTNLQNMIDGKTKYLDDIINSEKWTKLLSNSIQLMSLEKDYNYQLEPFFVYPNKLSLKNLTLRKFSNMFKIGVIENMKNNQNQVTHIVVSKKDVCDLDLVCLTGIANGLYIVHQDWISDSLEKNTLLNCENYEVKGTTLFPDCDGPKKSRICKQKLYPKLFDGISVHIFGSIGWEKFSRDDLKELVVKFGGKLLNRLPNPENMPTNIMPFHFRDNTELDHVSTIILYTQDSDRLVKFNMNHLKTFHISWFINAVQNYSFM